MTPKEAQLLQFFAADLTQDLARYHALDAALSAQHAAIMARDTAAIEARNTAMVELIGALHESSQRRSKIAQAFKLSPGVDSAQALAARLPPPAQHQALAQLHELTELMARCKGQNLTNGKLMAMHQELLSQLLDTRDSLYQPRYY